ncbi:MAG TPA: type II toxin-antitoxin system HicB family antitoxin [Isosphaeraceae bacterium]|jgi:predicted RNase H-like HicB family nuclease|nr:type II toxin-antitoxin system HicB family antitoxin [Isosphaeraceae bacterium]
MPSTLSVSLSVTVDVHEIEGGGFWGEVREFPGCVAQAETLEGLQSSISRAIRDWWAEPGVKTEEAARELAAIQGRNEIPDGPYPLPYGYQPPPSWTEADEDE